MHDWCKRRARSKSDLHSSSGTWSTLSFNAARDFSQVSESFDLERAITDADRCLKKKEKGEEKPTIRNAAINILCTVEKDHWQI